jgi:hypothetical protein
MPQSQGIGGIPNLKTTDAMPHAALLAPPGAKDKQSCWAENQFDLSNYREHFTLMYQQARRLDALQLVVTAVAFNCKEVNQTSYGFYPRRSAQKRFATLSPI